MKKAFKTLFVLILALTAAFTLASCSIGEKTTVHTHSFSSEWSYDDNVHYHSATCGHDVREAEAAHTFGEWDTKKEATETEDGSRERTCSVCGYTQTETIPALGHTHKFESGWSYNATSHYHASTCGHDVRDSEAAHTFGAWVTTKEATEDAAGSKERECTVCGYKETEAIPKLEHTHKFESGWSFNETNHYHASTCGHDIKDSEAAHTFNEQVVAATCTKKGYTLHTCSVCGYSYRDNETAALEHDYKFDHFEWSQDLNTAVPIYVCSHDATHFERKESLTSTETVTTEAGCETKGVLTYTVTYDGHTDSKTKEIPAKGHAFEEGWSHNETHHYHASTCGHDVKDSEAAHTFAEQVVAPTCEEKGYTLHTCSVCGYSYRDNEKDALEHDYKFDHFEWSEDLSNAVPVYVCSHDKDHIEKKEAVFSTSEVTTEPKCLEEGVKTFTVSFEGHTDSKTTPVPATGHSYSDEWTYNASSHWHAASCEHTDEKKDAAAHDFEDQVVAPTCTTGGYTLHTCKVCGYSYKDTETAALDHDYVFDHMDWSDDFLSATPVFVCSHNGTHTRNGEPLTSTSETAPAGCETDGLITYTVTYEGEDYTNSKVINKKGHTYSNDWSSDENGHWHVCTRCGKSKSDEAAHTFGDWVTDEEATISEVGSKHRVCSVCGYREEAQIPKLEALTDQEICDLLIELFRSNKVKMSLYTMINHQPVAEDYYVNNDIATIGGGFTLVYVENLGLVNVELNNGKYEGSLYSEDYDYLDLTMLISLYLDENYVDVDLSDYINNDNLTFSYDDENGVYKVTKNEIDGDILLLLLSKLDSIIIQNGKIVLATYDTSSLDSSDFFYNVSASAFVYNDESLSKPEVLYNKDGEYEYDANGHWKEVIYGTPVKEKHTFGDWEIDGDERVRECPICHKEDRESLTAVHNWDQDNAVFDWTDFLAGTQDYVLVTISCAGDNNHEAHTKVIEASVEYEIVTQPTHDAVGKATYTASVTYDEITWTDTKDIDIPKLEHEYEFSFRWKADDDHSAGIIVVTCIDDPELSGESDEIPAVIAVTTEPTCESPGTRTYTVSLPPQAALAYGLDEEYVFEEEIPALGHSYVFGAIIFPEGYKYGDEVKVVFVCENDQLLTHPIEITEGITVTPVRTEPTCTTSGRVVYTATYTDNEYTHETYTDTYEVTIPSLGHNYEYDHFVWSDDYQAADVVYVCSRCQNEISFPAEVGEPEIVPASCQATGSKTYTATYHDYDKDEDYEDTKVEVIDILEHTFIFVGFEWDEGARTAQAVYRCVYDDNHDHEHKYDATMSYTVTTEPTHGEVGRRSLTATYKGMGEDGEIRTEINYNVYEEIEKTPDHTYLDPQYNYDDVNDQVHKVLVCSVAGCEFDNAEVDEVMPYTPTQNAVLSTMVGETIVIKGTVLSISNGNVFITSEGSDTTIELYNNVQPDPNKPQEDMYVGDFVIVVGKVVVYSNQYEFKASDGYEVLVLNHKEITINQPDGVNFVGIGGVTYAGRVLEFTATPEDDRYTLSELYVNGKLITPVQGTYTYTVTSEEEINIGVFLRIENYEYAHRNEYTVATNVNQLTDGMNVLLAKADNISIVAGPAASALFNPVQVTLNGFGRIDTLGEAVLLTLVMKRDDQNNPVLDESGNIIWYLKLGEQFIGTKKAKSSNNALTFNTTAAAATEWIITIENGVATLATSFIIENKTYDKVMRYNPTNSQLRFTTYNVTNTMDDISILIPTSVEGMNYVQAAEATCEEDGNIAYYTDGIRNYADFHGQNVLTTSVVIDAIGHNWTGPVWSWEGRTSANATFTCSNCQETHIETDRNPEPQGEVYYAVVYFEGQEYTDQKSYTPENYTFSFTFDTNAITVQYQIDGGDINTLSADNKSFIVQEGQFVTITPLLNVFFFKDLVITKNGVEDDLSSSIEATGNFTFELTASLNDVEFGEYYIREYGVAAYTIMYLSGESYYIFEEVEDTDDVVTINSTNGTITIVPAEGLMSHVILRQTKAGVVSIIEFDVIDEGIISSRLGEMNDTRAQTPALGASNNDSLENATKLGINGMIFNVVASKNDASNITCKYEDLRFYGKDGNGSSITISSNNAIIVGVNITFASGSLSISIGQTLVETITESSYVSIFDNTFTLKNVSSGTSQVKITEMVIYYILSDHDDDYYYAQQLVSNCANEFEESYSADDSVVLGDIGVRIAKSAIVIPNMDADLFTEYKNDDYPIYILNSNGEFIEVDYDNDTYDENLVYYDNNFGNPINMPKQIELTEAEFEEHRNNQSRLMYLDQHGIQWINWNQSPAFDENTKYYIMYDYFNIVDNGSGNTVVIEQCEMDYYIELFLYISFIYSYDNDLNDYISEAVYDNSKTYYLSDGNGNFYEAASINDEEDFNYYVVSRKVVLRVEAKSANQTTITYVLVNDVNNLADGDVIVITNASGAKALGTQGSNNRTAVDFDLKPNTTNLQEITLVVNSGSWVLQVADGSYLYAAGGTSNNQLKSTGTIDDKARWTIEIATNGVATIKCVDSAVTRNWIKYNSSSSLFSCYASGQQDVYIYKKVVSSN